MSQSLDLAAREVLDCYPSLILGSVLVPLGSGGGFSGARLWRVTGTAGSWCLRAWPPETTSPQRLQTIHGWMIAAANAGLGFVPRVQPTKSGTHWVETAGRLWDLTTWMPGCADFHSHPSRPRLKAACAALALLHHTWSGVARVQGPCPAIQRRLKRVREWIRLVQSGWRPLEIVSAGDPVRPWVERGWPLLLQHLDQIPRKLAFWTKRAVPVQPCLCDVWHDHVLFTGDDVTGLVDYGAVKMDHVTVDLARLLGSLVGDDTEGRRAGLGAYSQVRPLDAEHEKLVDLLDETGTVLGIANWLTWLYAEGRLLENRAAVANRLGTLVVRLEQWAPSTDRNP
jgi:homoserine kinase type II